MQDSTAEFVLAAGPYVLMHPDLEEVCWASDLDNGLMCYQPVEPDGIGLCEKHYREYTYAR